MRNALQFTLYGPSYECSFTVSRIIQNCMRNFTTANYLPTWLQQLYICRADHSTTPIAAQESQFGQVEVRLPAQHTHRTIFILTAQLLYHLCYMVCPLYSNILAVTLACWCDVISSSGQRGYCKPIHGWDAILVKCCYLAERLVMVLVRVREQ